jgi:ABC-type uncharacterized transport system auxiliary subunit
MKPNGILRFAPVFLLAGVFPLLSCGLLGSKIPTRNYYIINYSIDVKLPASTARPYPFSVQLDRFDVQRIYSRQNIIYRFAPQELKWYEYQQWAVRPDYMITDLVNKHLESAYLFSRIGTEYLDTRPDFRMEGSLDALERLDSGDIIFGHLAMSFKMLRTEDGQQVWEYSFDDRKQVYQREMVYTVIALSQIMQTQMNMVVGQLDSLLAIMSTGAPVSAKPPVIQAPQGAPEDTTQVKSENPGYEIIPENRIKRK